MQSICCLEVNCLSVCEEMHEELCPLRAVLTDTSVTLLNRFFQQI
jgi:hypothetical protein